MTFLLGKRLLRGFFVDVEFASGGISEFRKILVAGDPIHPLLGFKQAKSEPSCSLVGVMPAFDVADVFLNQAVEVLDRVGRLEAPSDLLEDAEAVKRERPRQ